MYVSPAEISESVVGLALSAQLSQLPSGVLDKLIAKASQRADTFTQRRLQAPGGTTLAAQASAGATTLTVVSTLTVDSKAEQAVTFTDSSPETVRIQPGGVNVTSWTSPYPGTLTLADPLQFTHANGAPLSYVYKEVTEAGRASTSDPYSEALQSQAAQLALAHLPPIHMALTRCVFLRSYPIISVSTIEHSYSFDSTYNPIDTTGLSIEPTAGYYRFRIGQVILPEGLIRTTYIGGFQVVPDDVKEAVMLYLQDEMLAFANPYMATDVSMGKRRQAWQFKDGKSPAVEQAEDILLAYRRTV